VDGDTLSFATTPNPTNGTLNGTGANLTYTPSADFTGTDSFTFTVSDGTDVSNTATVSITVNAVSTPNNTNNRTSNFKGSTVVHFGNNTSGQVLGESTFNFQTDFGQGSTLDPDVTELQKILIADGYLVIPAPTGYFGSLTQAAVKQYQAAHGIQTTGYVGPLTRGALNAGSASSSDTVSTADTIADLFKQVQDLQDELDKLTGDGN
jgi:peptidoglycan hydrolase-like protein with peptidoglycan-binding domain